MPTEQCQQPLTEEELNTIEERANAASPGPWSAYADQNEPAWQVIGSRYGPIDVARIPPWITHVEPNAKFISAARTDVPRLVAEIRRQRAVLDQVDATTQRIAAGLDHVSDQTTELLTALRYLDAVIAAYDQPGIAHLLNACRAAKAWRGKSDHA